MVGAFLALLSSTLGQAHTDRIDSLQDELLGYTAEELAPVIAELAYYVRERLTMRTSLLVYEFLVKANTHLENLQKGGGNHPHLGEISLGSQLRPVTKLTDVIESAEKLGTLCTIGDAAGIATALGILCFLASVICLAKATQPPSVWIPAVAASSCVVALPVLGKLLVSVI